MGKLSGQASPPILGSGNVGSGKASCSSHNSQGSLPVSASAVQTSLFDPASTSSSSSRSEDPPLTPPPVVSQNADSATVRPNPPRKWVSLLQDTKLESVGSPTQHVTGDPFVLIPDEDITAARDELKEFMGRLIGVINAIWARTGPRIFVHKIGPESFLLRVVNPRTRSILLSRNLWNIAGHPMFVAPWSPDVTPEKPPLTKAQVTVEFCGIPYFLFDKSRIATGVGKPISLAPETERKQNFQVAKILVEVNFLRDLPTKLVSGLQNGKEFKVSITYPWYVKSAENMDMLQPIVTSTHVHYRVLE